MSKEPNRHQLSSRLAYSSHTPAFLQRLQKRVTGGGDEEEDDDEYEYDGSGRPPIPRRPSIPERPEGDPGSAEEDDEDESPQVVVLKEGKHLSAREAENERRKARGLSPLPDPENTVSESPDTADAPPSSLKASAKPKEQSEGLSFSSAGSASKSASKKRKIVVSGDSDDKTEKHAKKKSKKANKKLLSFDL